MSVALAALLVAASATAEHAYEVDMCAAAEEIAAAAATTLADCSRDLRHCATKEDFADPCSLELDQVAAAHSEYQAAVAEVWSHCD